jgi:Arc/MetJ-type ribon-helix-helix transcriptional regulator
MDVTIPKSLEAMVRCKVDESLYSTEEEVVGDALRLMQARDEATQIRRARLQDLVLATNQENVRSLRLPFGGRSLLARGRRECYKHGHLTVFDNQPRECPTPG